MAEVHAAPGIITLFEDFCGPEWLVTETAISGHIGPFRVVGEGMTVNDSGITVSETDPCLGGVGIIKCGNTAKESIGLTTGLIFDVAKMAPIVVETRFQMADGDTKHVFFGLSDFNTDDLSLEDEVVHGSATDTIAYLASHVCGFLKDTGLTTDIDDWYGVYKGGTAAAVTTGSLIDLGADHVDGEYQIFRLEVDPNGTARWIIDGKVLQTVEGAVSTTEDYAVLLSIEAEASEHEYLYVDYLYVRAGRDWTV